VNYSFNNILSVFARLEGSRLSHRFTHTCDLVNDSHIKGDKVEP